MAIENLKINYKAQNKNWTKPQIKDHKGSHKLTLIRPQTQHKRTKHMYSRSLTLPLAQSVEKIVNAHGFK